MGLDTVELLLWAEEEFGIEIPDRDAENILTVGDFSTFVHSKLVDIMGSAATIETEIFERIEQFLVAEFNVDAGKINRESYFVKDFRLDR